MEPLTLVVRSGLSEERATERMQPVLKAHRRGAKYAMKYVSDAV
jgi:hypothetical protein